MITDSHQKVTANHLKRNAYLYIRQSTIRQVFENTESTKRQYALRERAVALGWPLDRTVVIDSDLGQSGASAADREGFQKLVTEVSMGRVGIVLGLEVSRLARNSTDWHRLLEICALTDTLILDEDGIYDPAHFNDRLLLGLKGTMSEAELHILRARLRGGKLNKARRGELVIRPPVGYVYDQEDRLILDPDKQVQQSIRLLFDTFHSTGSASATVRAFRKEGLLFARRTNQGELVWGNLTHCHTLRVLHNPRYAGAFVFGQHRTRRKPEGGVCIMRVPREEWEVSIPDAHVGYISWEEYETNQRRLRESAQAPGLERRKSPPREGPALLQGIVLCGVCGRRMTVRYHVREHQLKPNYMCQQEGIKNGEQFCQSIPGGGIDEAVGELLVESVTPVALEVALSVHQELQNRLEEGDRLRQAQVERARYEADLARRRYMQVDPANRLVADALEADWNDKLRAIEGAQQEYERQRHGDRKVVLEEERAKIIALASDFPGLWRNPETPDRERKRMVRLLLEDVTLVREKEIVVHIRFKGGVTKTLHLPLPPNAWQKRLTKSQVVEQIHELLDNHTDAQIAAVPNERGFASGTGKRFTATIVGKIRRQYGLKTLYLRLREKGMLTCEELSKLLGVSTSCVKTWADNGLLNAQSYNDRNECLYENPGADPPRKMQGRQGKLSGRRRFPALLSDRANEVQCGA
jgi:DNA invertase Pin-like site-specific DNA recombinase/DNA-binding transcriptional regulator YiaG